MSKITHKYNFEPNQRPGGLKAATFSTTGKLFDDFEKYDAVAPLITGVWSSGAGTITLETGASKRIKGLKSLKLVTGAASDTLYRTIDTAIFGYPFPGNGVAPAFRYITFRIKTSATTNQTVRLKIWDASDTDNYAYIDIVVGNTDYREFCYDLNLKNTESFQAFTFGSTWSPKDIDRFGFINLPNTTTFYLDDIKFHYETSLVEMIGFGGEAPIEAGDPGSVQAKINALMGYVKGLEGRTYQYSKTSPNDLEVGDEAVWALELMSDFAPPTTTEIIPGVYQIDRVRHGGTSTQVGPLALQTLAGSMYVTYQPGEDVWTEGDLIKVTFSKGVAGLVANEYCVKTDEDPSNALTVDATTGQDHVHVANAYEYQVGWKVRLYEGATTEYLTIDALPDPTTVRFSTVGGLVNNYNDTTATLTRSVWTDLDTAVFYTRLTREPMIEFEGNSFFESDREDGAHTGALSNAHWAKGTYKVGTGTHTAAITGGKIVLTQNTNIGDYCTKDLYSIKSKYFRVVTDLDVLFTTVGASGATAGLSLFKGTAYDSTNHIEVDRYKDDPGGGAGDNLLRAVFTIASATTTTTVQTTDDAVALMLERDNRTWRAYYSFTKYPDYEWVLIDEVGDAADAFGEETSVALFAETLNDGSDITASFDNFKYLINSKFLEQMYDSPEIVPIVDKQVDPRVDQNTAAGGMEIFRVGLMDIRDGLPTAGEITPGTTLVNRYREGTDAGWVPQAAETITNAGVDGYIRAAYDFTSVGVMWKPGDQAQFTLSGVVVTDATTGRIYNVPSLAIYMVVGGPPNIDEPQNLWLGDVLGNKTDTPVPAISATASAEAYLKGSISRGMAAIKGICTSAVAHVSNIYSTDLVGYDNDFFKTHFYMQVIKATGAPISEVRKITGYTSTSGLFVCDAFSVAPETGDQLLVLHESLVAIGRDDIDNTFSSSSVAANEDGSVMERLEQIQEVVNKGTGTPIGADKSLVDALGSNGLAVADSAVSVLGAIGANNSNNAFDSSSVVADDDGSVLERLEWLATMAVIAKGTLTLGSTTAPEDNTRTNAADYFNGSWLMTLTGSAALQPRLIVDYTLGTGVPGTGVFTIDPEQPFTAATGAVEYVVLAPKESLVPGADVATNYTSAHVIGNKSDAVKITAGQSSVVSLLRDLIAGLGVVAAGAGTGFEIDGSPNLVAALGTTGGTVTDSATSVLGAIGANSASNSFDSSSVVPDVDGSTLERLEFLIKLLGNSTIYTSSDASTTTITAAAMLDIAGQLVGQVVIPLSGNEAGESRYITAYNGTDTVTVSPAWAADPDAGGNIIFAIASVGGMRIIPTALGTDGTTVTDSSTTVLGAIGANNANNAFDSSSVLPSADGSVLERLEDLHDDIADAGGLFYSGTCTSIGTDLTAVCSTLAGFGDDTFNNKYYIQIIYNTGGAGASPEPKVRKITDYDATSGTFTFLTVTDATAVGDKILIIHESLAAIGRDGTDSNFDSGSVVADADGTVLEREEYIQTQLGYGAKLLTEDFSTGGNKTVITSAAELTEVAGVFKGALVVCITGDNAGMARPVVSNIEDTSVTVFPAFVADLVAGSTFLLLSAYKPQIPEKQADVAVNTTAPNGSEANIFNLAVPGYSYEVSSLRLKSAACGANSVTVTLYELINDAPVAVDTFTIDTINDATYFSLVDMFGMAHLAGDNLKVAVQGNGAAIGITGQYSYSVVYTGAG